MARSKKTRSDDLLVMYVRVKRAARDKIAQLAKKRGYPHTLASVLGDVIDRGLASAATTKEVRS